MAVIARTAASLRFRGDGLQPETIGTLLCCRPDTSATAGGLLRTASGAGRIARTGLWTRSVARRAPGDLDAQVAELLALATGDLAVWRRLTEEFEAHVFCGLFLEEHNQGLALAPATLFALGARGLGLELDVYAPAPGG